MDFSQLRRDGAAFKNTLQMFPDDSSVYTKTGCKLYFPQRFLDRGMAFVGSDNSVCGIVAAVLPTGEYSVLLVNAMVPMEPDTVEKINYLGVDYVEFGFMPGSRVIKTVDLVKNDVLIYKINNELISKGNVPWYLDYDDMAGLFDTAAEHAGTNIAENSEVTELLVSLIARDEGDRTIYYRSTVATPEDLKAKKVAWIAMMSAAYSATNTLNKLGGSYFTEGALSAMVYPTERMEKIEEIIRA